MQLDDRDIICEQDYTPLSNAELVAAIEQYAAIMHTAPLVDFDLEWITGPARALLARVEAAEALAYERLEAALFAEQRATDAEVERDELRDANSVLSDALEKTRQALGAVTARVAELESQLAAQQWRPVTEDWPPYNERVLIGHNGGYGNGWYAVARRAYNNEDIWVMDDDTFMAFESATVAMIVPPRPAPQEPTQ